MKRDPTFNDDYLSGSMAWAAMLAEARAKEEKRREKMGEIANMHVEAYAAGLDPNEMDGADWADFYDDQEPVTPLSLIEAVAADVRMLLCAIDDLQDSDDFDARERAGTLALYVPEFGEKRAAELMRLLVELNDAANAEADRLEQSK